MRFLHCLCLPLVLMASSSAPAADNSGHRGDWPQWRGPARDGISREAGLLKSWPENGPPVVWEVDTVGVGYSSLAIHGGRIITLGDLDGVEHIIALAEDDGSLLWAVQPAPVARALAEKIAAEVRRLDANRDGTIDEAEALTGLGTAFFEYDRAEPGDPQALAARRAAELVKLLDRDGNGVLDYAEAGRQLRDAFARIDASDKTEDPAQIAASRAAAIVEQQDKNADGQLDRNEGRGSILELAFRQMDAPAPGTTEGDGQVTVEEMIDYFTRRERGLDGQITVEELAAYYQAKAPGKDGRLSPDELRSYFGGYRNNQGDGPRGTPSIDGDRVYVEGGNGDVTCLDARTGETIWHVNLVTDLGGGRPGWGYSESPLVMESQVIVTPGGRQGTLAALDKQTGRVLWRSTDTTQPAHYSSPVLAEIAGKRQIVQFARENLFGVTPDGGRLLWTYSKANNGTANCATPVIEGDYVFASSSYGTGGGLVHITGSTDGKLAADEVYFEKSMANHHGGMVRVGDYLYGFGNGGLLCMNYHTGEIVWRARSVNKGSLTVADGMLYLLGERHEVALAEATPEEYREHGRFRIDDLGRPSWAHPVVAGGRFYIRNQGRLTAYNVAAPIP